MKEIFYKYQTFLLRRGLSERSLEYYLWHCKKFFEYTKCQIKDFWNLEQFRKKYDKIIARNISNEGKKKYLKCMRIFWDFLIEENLIFENVARKVKPPKVQLALPIPVEDTEIRDIFQAVSRRWSWMLAYRNRMIVETFLNTWLRRSELINLKRCDISKSHITVRCWKWWKDRIVYLPVSFLPSLEEYLIRTDGVSEYLFFSLRSKKISIRAMSKIFEEIKKEARIDILHAHRMRHTYASRVIESGISLAVLRDQLWHSNIATTSRYIAVRNKYREEEMRKFRIL